MSAAHAKQAFVSFCGRDKADKAVARSLLARLNAQPLEAWIYERPGEFDPPGGDVSKRLFERIRSSDTFVALVTAKAFESRYVRDEVQYALELAQRGGHGAPLIAPLVPETLGLASWPEPFEGLREFEPYYFRVGEEDAIEPTITRVCEGLDIGYLPPDPFHVRLPLRRRLMMEIGEERPRQKKYDAGTYDSLLQSALECEQAQAHGNADAAILHLRDLRGLMKAEFQDLPGYYPRIVEGALQAETGDWRRARETFRRAIAKGEDLADESAYGGVGFTYMQEGRPAEAATWYLKAARICPTPDPAIAFNLLLCQMATGERFDRRDVDRLLGEEGGLQFLRSQEERTRIEFLRAIAYAHLGQVQDAERVFARACDDEDPPVDLLVDFAHRLDAQIGDANVRLVDSVSEVLERAAAARPDWQTLHPLARLAYERGDTSRAARAFERLCGLHPGVPQFQVEHALSLLAGGHARSAKAAARRALRKDAPTNGYGFEASDGAYYEGFAHWILGHKLRARRAFARSQRPSDEWYARLQEEP